MKLFILIINLFIFCFAGFSQKNNTDTLPVFLKDVEFDAHRGYSCRCYKAGFDTCASFMTYMIDTAYVDDYGVKDYRRAYVDSLLLSTFVRINDKEEWIRTDYDQDGTILHKVTIVRKKDVSEDYVYDKFIWYDEYGDIHSIDYFFEVEEKNGRRKNDKQ